jgi:outer membrane protein
MLTVRMSVRPALAGMLSLLLVAAAGHSALADDTATTKPAAAKPASSGATAPVIIVIDTDKIRRESAAGKSVDQQADVYGKAFEDQNRTDEAGLRAAQQEIQKQQGTLPQEQFAEKARQFDQKAGEVQRAELKRRQAFEKSFNAAILKWQQAMIDASRDVATAHNADVVMRSQALLFYNSNWDVTSEVIDLLNKRLSKVDFPPPKIEPDAPGMAGAQDTGAAPTKESKEKKPKPQTLQLSPQQ